MSLPEALLEEVERIVRAGKYSSLSEFVRDAVRDKLQEVRE